MIEYNGIQWQSYQRMLIPLAGPHVDTGMKPGVAKQMVAKHRAVLMRWVSDFDCASPTDWWYVIKDTPVSLEELSTNSRHDVRRGLDRCTVSKLDAKTIAQYAYPVYKSAFATYQTRSRIQSEAQFADSILRNPRKDQADYWGCFDNASGKLVGYCKNRFENNCCEYIYGQWDPEYLKIYSSVALIYEMNRYYLNERGALYVSDGQRSISHGTTIQEFLIHKFKFRKAYCRLNIVYSPAARILVNFLYPLRARLAPLGDTLNVLLKQEEIRRSFEPEKGRLT